MSYLLWWAAEQDTLPGCLPWVLQNRMEKHPGCDADLGIQSQNSAPSQNRETKRLWGRLKKQEGGGITIRQANCCLKWLCGTTPRMQGAQKYHSESARWFIVTKTSPKLYWLITVSYKNIWDLSLLEAFVICMAVVWDIKAVHDELVPYLCLWWERTTQSKSGGVQHTQYFLLDPPLLTFSE